MASPPRIVPGRGKHAGQAFVLHGCMSDGPFTYPQAELWLKDLQKNPIPKAVYDDYEARGLGGRATHFLTVDGDGKVVVDPAILARAEQNGDR